MHHIIILLCLSALHVPFWPVKPVMYSGCNETLNAGPDVTICHPGGNVQLNATFSGDPSLILDIEWEPAAGLSDPTILNPTASVSQTTTYTLMVKHFSGVNLFVNGDFEQGNTGFVSDYIHSPNNLVPEGVYAITPNPSIQHPGFAPCGDHTSGSGNMMAVNGAATPGLNVWCQTVTVLPNTTYIFSAWLTNLHPSSPAILQFSVNGILLGDEFTADPPTCDWQQFYIEWFSGANTTATFCVVNQNTQQGGNDFALDDIYLSEVCEYTDEVTIYVEDEIREQQSYMICFGESVNVGGQDFFNAGYYEVQLTSFLGCDSIIEVLLEVVEVEAYIEDPLPITCQDDQVVLDGSLSAGTFGISSYQWSTVNGAILTNPQAPSISVGATGTYQLLVSTNANGHLCWDSITVVVPIDTAGPVFAILEPEPLSCGDSVTTLQAVANDLPPGALLEWDSPEGVILSGFNTLTPTVQGAGHYQLTITDPLNGCTATRFVELLSDTLKPVLQAASVPNLTCRDTQVVLMAQVLSPAGGYTIMWSTTDGHILSGGATLQPTVNAAGQYKLVVIDTLSGCESSLTLTVTEDRVYPDLTLPAMDTLGCQQDSLLLSVVVSPDTLSYNILWSTGDGVILSGSQSAQAMAGAGGSYRVIVENATNGCTDSATIEVIRHEVLPQADAGPDLVLNCQHDSMQPLSLGSDQTPEMQYQWILNGVTVDSVLQPWLDQAGSYVLVVYNTQNRCSSTDTLTVTDERVYPEVMISPSATLTCATTSIAIDASQSDSGQHTYQWQGPVGGILSGPTTLLPSVQQPGWYILIATDTTNHCTTQDSIYVSQDVTPPQAVIATPDSLDCNSPQVLLEASGSQPVGGVSFSWQSIGGNIVSGAGTATPLVNAGGWYLLTLTDIDNGCTTVDSVYVFQDPNLPVAFIVPTDTLTCDRMEVMLQGGYQAPGSNLVFSWTTPDGNILTDPGQLTITVDRPGTYRFGLSDNDTGCQTFDEVIVVEDVLPLSAEVTPPAPLTCTDTLRTLTLMTAGPASVRWSTTSGILIGDPEQPAVTATATGIYKVLWINQRNGCSDSLEVFLGEDKQLPTADAGGPYVLPCDPATMTLDGSGSSGQGTLTYDWTFAQGVIVSGGQTPTPLIAATGMYVLRISDSANGCMALDSALVIQDLPRGLDMNLSPPGCRREEGELALFGSTGGQPPYQIWLDGTPYPPGTSLLLASGVWPVEVEDALGCRFDTTIIMPPRQELYLEVPPEVWVAYGDSGRIELRIPVPSAPVDTVIWDPHLYLTPTEDKLVWYTHALLAMQYRVKVKTIDGCEVGGLIQVLIDNDPRIFVPNVFSPLDGNGINDRLFPYSKSGTVRRIHRMAVYDRWGTKVYEQADFPPDDAQYGWDGYHRGRLLNPGVFVWVIEAELNTGAIVILKGDVTLF